METQGSEGVWRWFGVKWVEFLAGHEEIGYFAWDEWPGKRDFEFSDENFLKSKKAKNVDLDPYGLNLSQEFDKMAVWLPRKSSENWFSWDLSFLKKKNKVDSRENGVLQKNKKVVKAKELWSYVVWLQAFLMKTQEFARGDDGANGWGEFRSKWVETILPLLFEKKTVFSYWINGEQVMVSGWKDVFAKKDKNWGKNVKNES